jgi:hypothetical protein
MSTLRDRWRLTPLILLALPLIPAPAEGGDVIVFVAFPSPERVWSHGYGAALSATMFGLLRLEGEAARIPAERPEDTLTSFTGSALLAPSLGFLTPYGGLGIGFYRQAVGGDSESGVLRCFVLGLKVKVGLVVLKAEYRDITLSDEALLPMDYRLSAGIGISF